MQRLTALSQEAPAERAPKNDQELMKDGTVGLLAGRPVPDQDVFMQIQQLGHVVLKVRDRERSERFYNEQLGIPIAARMDAPPMTFFTLGNHHDFAIGGSGACSSAITCTLAGAAAPSCRSR